MHRMVNSLYDKQRQLDSLLSSLPANEKYTGLKKDGDALLKKMKAWDEDMVQRKSKAYDDVENFPNKFTANYLFLINHTESDLPRVNQPSLDRLKEQKRRGRTVEEFINAIRPLQDAIARERREKGDTRSARDLMDELYDEQGLPK